MGMGKGIGMRMKGRACVDRGIDRVVGGRQGVAIASGPPRRREGIVGNT